MHVSTCVSLSAAQRARKQRGSRVRAIEEEGGELPQHRESGDFLLLQEPDQRCHFRLGVVRPAPRHVSTGHGRARSHFGAIAYQLMGLIHPAISPGSSTTGQGRTQKRRRRMKGARLPPRVPRSKLGGSPSPSVPGSIGVSTGCCTANGPRSRDATSFEGRHQELGHCHDPDHPGCQRRHLWHGPQHSWRPRPDLQRSSPFQPACLRRRACDLGHSRSSVSP